MLYSLVTTSNFDTEDYGIEGHLAPEGQGSDAPMPAMTNTCLTLSRVDAQRCRRLMRGIVDHFTPILFTPATTSHMTCTDVFADQWMSLVIQPALENDGVYKPLETLQYIIDIDWWKYGLCSLCVTEKRTEWLKEQEDIWDRTDSWID